MLKYNPGLMFDSVSVFSGTAESSVRRKTVSLEGSQAELWLCRCSPGWFDYGQERGEIGQF